MRVTWQLIPAEIDLGTTMTTSEIPKGGGLAVVANGRTKKP
jgi:hypothetical protein